MIIIGNNIICGIIVCKTIISCIVHIAGRLGSNIRQTGEIRINGHKQVLAYGTSVWKEDNRWSMQFFFFYFFFQVDQLLLFIVFF
jgi:hypothetical protein